MPKQWDVKHPLNGKKRVCDKCDEGCNCYSWASLDNRTKSWVIKRYNDEHHCKEKWKMKVFIANFLADKYLKSFRVDEDMNLKNFSRVVYRDWNMTVGRTKLQCARRLAMNIIYGREEGQYKKLWDYANESKRSNSGGSF